MDELNLFRKQDSKTSCIVVNYELSINMANIVFEKSGVTAPWTGTEESILELGEIHDLDLDYGCRMGNCTSSVTGRAINTIRLTNSPTVAEQEW